MSDGAKYGLAAVGGVVALLVIAAISAIGSGGSDSQSPSIPPEARAAARSYRETFGVRPFRCETDYYTIYVGIIGSDVTYCYSKRTFVSARFPEGKPVNSGCYVTKTGKDVTVAVRVQEDDQSIC